MDNLNNLYQELIIDHGTNPRNFVPLINATIEKEGFNPLCGDRVMLFLKIKDNIIIQATFQGEGCAISTASASIMTEILVNKTSVQAIDLVNNFIAMLTNTNTGIDNNLDKLPNKLLALTSVKNYPSRIKCATLAWHTLGAALQQN